MLKPVTRRRLKVYFVTLTVAVIAVVAGFFVNLQIRHSLEQNLLNEYVEQESLIAEQVAQSLQNNIAAVREKLQIIATMPEVKAAQTVPCTAKLNEVFAIMENNVGNLGRVNRDGVFACSLNKALVGTKAEKLGNYIPQIFNDPQHKPVLSRAVKPVGADSYIAAVHVPVYTDKGVFDGTLGGAIYFNQIQDKLLQDITFAQNGFVTLYDDNGDVLYHPESQLVGANLKEDKAKSFFNQPLIDAVVAAGKSNRSGSVRYVGGDIEKLATYRSFEILPGHRWVTLVTVPVADAQAALLSVGLTQGFWAFTAVQVAAIFAIAITMLVGRLKALEVDQAKDEFLQLATHQLQNPVTGINWNLDLLTDGTTGPLNDMQKKGLKEIRDCNEQQRITVNDLLNVARLESGRLQLNSTSVDVNKLIQQAASDLHGTIVARKQKLKISEAPPQTMVTLDADRFRMVLDNLLSNASKYTLNEGELEIGAAGTDNGVELYVQDSGVGIDPKDHSKLFKKFSRIANPLTEERGGTGLGLYLVKEIVALHGSTIEVSSQVDKGTRFTITLRR